MRARLIFPVLILIPSVVLAAEYPWQLKKDEKGIRVQVRKVEGSPIVEFNGRMVVDAAVEETAALYENAELAQEWFHQCSGSRLLERQSEGNSVLYFRIDMPWPVRDRDAVYRRVKTVDAATGAVSYALSVVPDYPLPVPDGVIRMPSMKGLWRFTPVEGGGTEVYYQQHGDVGGSIPAVVVNSLSVNIPYHSFMAFRKILGEKNGEG